MKETIYVKTPAGQQEILDRQLRLHPRLRALLVLIDGRHAAGELLATLSGIGVSEVTLDELLRHGLIEACSSAAEHDPGPLTEPAPQPARDLDDIERRRELYAYFNEAIRDHLGLRGFMLQLQVEKAETLDDYRAIREQFLAAVHKNKGGDFARSQGEHIDTLLGA